MIIYRTAIRTDGKYWIFSYPIKRTNQQIVRLVNYDNKYGWFRENHFDDSDKLDPNDYPQIDITNRKMISMESSNQLDLVILGYEFLESDLS